MSTCHHIDCGGLATHTVAVNVPATGYGMQPQPIEVFMGVELCEEHAKELITEESVAEFMRDNTRLLGYISSAALVGGRAQPDFDRAWGHILPLDAPVYLEYLAITRDRKGDN